MSSDTTAGALESIDGALRGLFDQAQGPVLIRNEIVVLLRDYLSQLVHGGMEERGIEAPFPTPGADALYHHDTSVDGSFIRQYSRGASRRTAAAYSAVNTAAPYSSMTM